MLTLPVQFSALASPYCFSTWQQALADFSAVQSVQFPGNFTTYNFGVTSPSPADRDKPWRRTDTNGNPRGNWVFSQGVWLMEHPLYNPKTDIVMRALMMLEVETADIPALDGGEAGAVTDTSGPMWELVTEFAARMPIAAGTLPSGTALAIGDTGGEEKHLLTLAESPSHDHGFVAGDNPIVGAATGTFTIPTVAGAASRARNFESAGGDQPHNNLPPYFVIQVLRKSLRKYWRLDP